MTIRTAFTKSPDSSADTLVIGVYEEDGLTPSGAAFDRQTGGFIAHALKGQEKFKGKTGTTFSFPLPAKSGHPRVLLVGFGKKDALTAPAAETIGGKLYAALAALDSTHAAILCDDLEPEQAARLALGLNLRSYRFDKYRTTEGEDGKPRLTGVDIVTGESRAAQTAYKPLAAVAEGVYFARDLVNEPPNVLYPDSFARRIAAELKPLGVQVDIYDEKKMQKLGMGSFLAVGQGSERKPRMVVMRWNGTASAKSKKKSAPPLALVGKGVTFDTGGISIKPAEGMDLMKMDMGGAAAVVGTIRALAKRGAKVDVIGAVGLAENMPSGNAYRPGDIVTSLSGKTVEVLNTDAEGRLILIDVLTFVQRTYNPANVIDLATLTGAMMVSLGHEYAGAFVNNDPLWQQLESAAKDSGEKLWRMPLDEVYRKDMESSVADLKNVAGQGRMGGACTAAGFLEHVIEENVSWAHLDIAGTAWWKTDKPTVPKGGTGYGVRLLHTLVQDHYEA